MRDLEIFLDPLVQYLLLEKINKFSFVPRFQNSNFSFILYIHAEAQTSYSTQQKS